MADFGIDEHIIKVHVLENNINNLSAKVEKLCEHLDDSLPRLAEMHLKLQPLAEMHLKFQDDFTKRKIIEKHVDHILEQVTRLNTVQVEQQKKLDTHHTTLQTLQEESNYQKTLLKTTKTFWKTLVSVVSFVLMIAGGIYAYEKHKTSKNSIKYVNMSYYDK